MQRVAFPGELTGEIRIAFPITKIGALDGAIATGGKTAVRQSVGQDVTGHSFQFGASGKVSASVRRITPRPILGPVPGGHPQFSVVAVSNGSPARRESLLNDVWCIDLVDVRASQNINRTAKGTVRVKRIDGVARCRIDPNGAGLGCYVAGVDLSGRSSDLCHKKEKRYRGGSPALQYSSRASLFVFRVPPFQRTCHRASIAAALSPLDQERRKLRKRFSLCERVECPPGLSFTDANNSTWLTERTLAQSTNQVSRPIPR